jgi:glycerophosphoryl diester phosphodiesterase
MPWEPIRPRADRPLIVAHRGSSGTVPENTFPAYERAVTEGAEIIEIDVHLTADRELVVIHDDTLPRTTDAATALPEGSHWVRDRTLAEIRSLTAGRWEGEELRVPTFTEVLDLVRRLDVGLLVETKTEHGLTGLEDALAAEVKRLPDWAEWVAGRLMVCSFDYGSLLRAGHALPGVHLALILGQLVADGGTIVDVWPTTHSVASPGRTLVELRDRLAADGVGYLGMAVLGVNGQAVDDFTAETVELFRAGGVEVNFVTDDPAEMQRLTDRGVSSILTNHPARLASLLGVTPRPTPEPRS